MGFLSILAHTVLLLYAIMSQWIYSTLHWWTYPLWTEEAAQECRRNDRYKGTAGCSPPQQHFWDEKEQQWQWIKFSKLQFNNTVSCQSVNSNLNVFVPPAASCLRPCERWIPPASPMFAPGTFSKGEYEGIHTNHILTLLEVDWFEVPEKWGFRRTPLMFSS